MGIGQDKEFELLLADKRHGELLSAIRQISSSFKIEYPKSNENVAALNVLVDKIETLIKSMASAKSKPDSVQASFDDRNIVDSVGLLGKEIMLGLSEIKAILAESRKPDVWEFEVKRNKYSNFVESITAIKK